MTSYTKRGRPKKVTTVPMKPNNRPDPCYLSRSEGVALGIKEVPSKADFIEYHETGTLSINEWRQIFLDLEDLTEYEFAIQVVGGWNEWSKFKLNWPTFRNKILPAWKEELRAKLNSRYFKRINASLTDGEVNLSALKWFMEGKYTSAVETPEDTGEIKKYSKTERSIKEDEDDLARIQKSRKLVASSPKSST